MSDDAIFAHAAVAAPHALAAQAGRDILAQGGNALEAMIGMAAAIAVVYPHMNSIGGDGFWIVREPKGKVRAIEACGFAGAGATREAYEAIGGIPTRGPLAALTVPGAVGGWKAALELGEHLGGNLPLADLLGPAAKFAREGVPISASEERSQPRDGAGLYDSPNFKATYFVDDAAPKAGVMRKQPLLAETLAQLADAGLEDFYRGDIARELATDLEKLGSPVTRADLKAYSARWREPLTIKTTQATLYNTPVPTQGLASLMILGVYDRLRVKDIESVDHAHALIEATKRVFAHRDRACVDFDHATEDFDKLLSPAFLQAEAAQIDMKRASPWPMPPAKGDTIWMGAIDNKGLAVSYIQSLYWEYGSGVVLPRTGVLMQNRGIAFSLDPASPRLLAPGRRPFHTLNPALAVFADGRVMSYGSMGGDGQPQFQAQVFTRIAAGDRLARAVAAPRWLWGKTWGADSVTVKVEEAFDDSIASGLAKRGHEIERLPVARRDGFGHAGGAAAGSQGRDRGDPRSSLRRRRRGVLTTPFMSGKLRRSISSPMSISTPLARGGSRLRLSQFGWMRRALLVTTALVGSVAVAYAANLASRNLLWQVARACALDKSTTGSPLPCLEANVEAGYAVLRPPFGRTDTILTPLKAIKGLEDPQVQAPDAPNYFALAYAARSWIGAGKGRIALAVNSRLARSQDQLHIHMGCLSSDFAGRLSGALGPKSGVWFRAPDMAPGLELWTYRLGGAPLDEIAPFRLLKALLGEDKAIARTTLAVVEGTSDFVVVAIRSRPGGWYAAAEDVVEGNCRG